MFKALVAVAAIGLLATQECRAQFVDTFDGNALAPHWQIFPSPGAMQHHVSGGMLHVTGLPSPSNPKAPTNFAAIGATFPGVSGNFIARASVGWQAGEDRQLQMQIGSSTALLGAITYSELAQPSPQMIVHSGFGPVMSFPAPGPGVHEFVLARQGSTMSAYVDGLLLTSFPAAALNPVQSVTFGFDVAYPNGGMQPMHIDLAQIVPGPGATAVLSLIVTAGVFRRRS